MKPKWPSEEWVRNMADLEDKCESVSAGAPLPVRMARCSHYGGKTARHGAYGGGNECNYGQSNHAICTCERPSDSSLPFFESCVDGTWEANLCKWCGYAEVAHTKQCQGVCTNYKPRGDRGYDRFYCGCHGWD